MAKVDGNPSAGPHQEQTATDTMALKPPAWMMTTLRLTATVVVFTLIFRQIDMGSLLHQMSRLSPWILMATYTLVFSQFLLIVCRWTIILNTLQPPFSGWVALRIMFMAEFFGKMMPSAIGGDLFRVWYTSQEVLSV